MKNFKDVWEDAAANSVAGGGVSLPADAVKRKKKKPTYDGRTKEGRKFVERMIARKKARAEAQDKKLFAQNMKSIAVKEDAVEEKKRPGPMDRSKLTGQEISVYFRKNPVKDKMVRKAVEYALDHGGAMNFAVKGIEKMKKGLSNHPEVKKALRYANESVSESTDVYDREGVAITRFAMGKGKGVGFQLNYNGKFIQIPRNQIKAVVKGLNAALKAK